MPNIALPPTLYQFSGIYIPVNLAVKSIIARTLIPKKALNKSVLKNLWLFIAKNNTLKAKTLKTTIKNIKKAFIISPTKK